MRVVNFRFSRVAELLAALRDQSITAAKTAERDAFYASTETETVAAATSRSHSQPGVAAAPSKSIVAAPDGTFFLRVVIIFK